MIQFGNDKIKDIYVGSDKIKEVYYGSELVYTAQDPRGYWVHKDTGVKTYFGLDDPRIVNGIMTQPSWWQDCSEVQLPSGVTGIDNSCFYWCSLASITLPESLTSLGGYCFEGCSSLTSITLPESVTSIGIGCFFQCSSLILATVLPSAPPSLGANVFDNIPAPFNIKVPSSSVNAYKSATNWNEYASIISAI